MDDRRLNLGTGSDDLNASHALVIGQLGQSLDGRIALPSGESKYISGSHALDHVHQLRADVDAVIVGVATVLTDDPLLTVRRVPGRSPARVVIDPSGRLPPTAQCLKEDGVRRLVVRRRAATVKLSGAPVPPPLPLGVEEVELEADTPGGSLSPRAVLEALAQRGLRRILVEGGPRTLSAFLDAGCLDVFHIVVSPVILGSGRPGLDLAPIAGLSDALRPATRVHVFPDGDVLFACDLRQRAGQEASHGPPSSSDPAAQPEPTNRALRAAG